MTLYLQVKQVQNLKQDGVIFVEGSKAGLIVSKPIQSGSHRLKQIFQVICSSTDSLIFKFCKSQSQNYNNECIGMGQILAPILIKKNPNINLDNDLVHQLQLFNQNNQLVGIIICEITYDKVSYYQGQFTQLNKFPTGPMPVAKNKKVQLYKGKCATKNLFSLLDPACDGQQAKFIQSFYKDDVI